jgi:hypothetical protein
MDVPVVVHLRPNDVVSTELSRKSTRDSSVKLVEDGIDS